MKKGNPMRRQKFIIIMSAGITIGFILSIVLSFSSIIVNRYVQYKLFRLIMLVLRNNLNSCILYSIFGILILYLIWFLLAGKLKFGKNKIKHFGMASISIIIVFLVFDRIFERITTYSLPTIIKQFVAKPSLKYLKGIYFNYFSVIPRDEKLKLIALAAGIITIVSFFYILFSKIKWDKVLDAARRRYSSIRNTAMCSIVFLSLLNICVIIDGRINLPHGPNVILISVDTLRVDHLGCYGYSKNTTPNIDRFSKESVLFENCIVQAPSTLPSHASMFTSLLPSHHGALYATRDPIPQQITTLTEFLKNKNYKTISYNGGAQVSASFGFGQGFDKYHSLPDSDDTLFKTTIKDAIEWLERHNGDNFFLFLHTYQTHHPYTPPKRYLRQFEASYAGSLTDEISIKTITDINSGKIKITGEDLRHIINCYDAEIKSMDEAFLLLQNYLKKQDIYDNTLIIFTSDHGEEFNEHGWVGWHSHTLYDELIKAPLIIRFPHANYAGKIINQQVRSIDILPTVLHILDIQKTSLFSFDGIDLMPIIQGKQRDEKLYAISQLDNLLKPLPVAIRTEHWKLYNSRLFDLENDPSEQKNVAQNNKKIKDTLTDILNYLLKENPYDIKNKKTRLDKETLDKLKSLGYIK